MTTFRYLAVDNQGKLQKGMIDAESAKQARQLLRERKLIPTEIQVLENKSGRDYLKTVSFKNFSLKFLLSRSSLSSQELTLITRQLATLFKAGLPISEVLTAVAEQSTSPKATGIMLSVRAKVMGGHSLAAALSEQTPAFSPLFCGIVASGERSGKLAPILERLAAYTEEQHRLKQKISYALIYPSALILVSMTIVIFLLEYVVPKMVGVYGHLNQTLPLLTRLLIALSQGLESCGFYLLLLFLASLWGFRASLKKKPPLREKFHRFLLRVPFLGKTLRSINTARYSKTLAMLCSSGLPLLESMKTASQLITNLPIQKAVEEAANHVREGAAIHLALKQTSFFSPMSIHLIASGEASGELEALLEQSADQQEEEITRLIDSLMALFEPALIILMGGMVLFIVLAVLLPIFDLNQLTL